MTKTESPKHIFHAPDEKLWLYSMGKRYAITAIFSTNAEANDYMEKHDEQCCIAHFEPFVFLASKYDAGVKA